MSNIIVGYFGLSECQVQSPRDKAFLSDKVDIDLEEAFIM